jgi:membrane-associated tyrosine/threonine-specific cdc2-inhibitory kinase
VFFDEPFFSQRKRTPSKVPPKAPSKSCPPVSRVFNNSRYKNGALKISFLSESVNEPIISPHYTAESSQQYFEQCFEIIQKLGEGSFGEVFKVRNKEDGKLYAVKRSRERFNGEWDRRKKLDEVEKHERLSYHPNCVKFHRAWEERLHLFIQTELCLMSLSNYCDMHGKMSERRIWRVLYDVVKGLKHLHDNRLCHLDIKPANIFLSQDGVTCKLGDFGLVVSADSGFTEALEGDSCYVAPELLEGRFSMAADIFSLGISLLELVCDLELPSDGPSWQALRTGHLPQEFIKGLSPSLVSLLSQMMSHDPSTRPTVDDLLAHRSLKIVHYTQPVVHLANRIVSYLLV